MSYQYPISHDWKTDEIVDVIKFFGCVEKAYEGGVERDSLINDYKRFKEIVPSKSEEKKICGEFEETTGYSSYKIIKKAMESEAIQKIKG